jgi:hypothetical protein
MPLAHETVLQIRERYAAGDAVSAICAQFDVNKRQVYQCVHGSPAEPDQLPPLPLRRVKPPSRRSRRMRATTRKDLVQRLWRSAEQQVDEVEQRLARADQATTPERERDTRLLAMLAKTLRELTAIEQAKADKAATKGAPRDDDDAVPRDLDELRRELARRIDLLRRRRTGAAADGGASA